MSFSLFNIIIFTQEIQESTHGKILKDDVIKSHSFVEIMGGGGCKQGWRFILAILLLNFSYQKAFP
jgi:hypothetical protein